MDPRPNGQLPELSPGELQRYARHLTLPGIGVEGQRRLKAARVLVVGTGGLGSPVALYLAAAGVGTIGLVDMDQVDVTNLQRQILHGTAAVGAAKVVSGEARLRDLNPGVQVVPHPERLSSANAMELIQGYDVVVDGSDNFPTRYLVNDACVLQGKPNVYGSIFQFEGQASLFAPGGPCYRCLFAEPPPAGMVPSCAEAGVLGALPGIIGSIQALETLKWITGAGETLRGRLLLLDALGMRFRELKLRKDPGCAVCGPDPTVTELQDYEAFCGVGSSHARGGTVEPGALRNELLAGAEIVLLDVREPYEWAIGHLADAIHIPLGELPERLGELNGHDSIVTYCHHGQRSDQAAELLRAAGFGDVRNLEGGIDAWARLVEPTVRRY